jgi:hypothetical protein
MGGPFNAAINSPNIVLIPKVNREKTSLFFSQNTKMEVRTHILTEVGVTSTPQYEKYLGLPALIG